MKKDEDKTKEQLINELKEMRQRVTVLEKPEVERVQTEKSPLLLGYQGIFEVFPIGVTVLDMKGVILYCNSAVYSEGGYTEGEFTGKHFSKIASVRLKDIPKLIRVFNSIVRGKIPQPFEVIYQRKDGTTGWSDLHISLTKIGGKRHILVIQYDVTERKQAAEALRESEEKYRELYENAPVLLHTLNKKGVILDCNKVFQETIGYRKEEMIGKQVYDFETEESRKLAPQALGKVAREGTIHGERDFITKDGKLVTLEFSAHVEYDEERNEMIIESASKDITERKQTEEALRESEERFRRLFEESNDAVFIHDFEGRLLDVNDAASKMLGYPKDELIKILVPTLHPEEELTMSKEAFQTTMKKGAVRFETKFRKSDGTIIDVDISSRIVDRGKEVIQGIVRDITERKQAEEELEKHREHLEELVGERTSELEGKTIELEQANIHLHEMDRLKFAFLASMSHELRTPLNSIIGFTGIILQGMAGEINEEQRKQITMVKNSASHLLSLINDVLDISGIEAGRVELSLKEFSLDDVAREVVETLSPTVSEKGLELLTEVPEGITLFGDRRHIERILMNLVSNAVKFTDQGNVRIAARVLEDDNLEVRVIDTGVGIKREDMDKLFQPFQQIDVPLMKKHKGTGLGLYLSKKLADLLSGDISAKSEYGRGSEFTFTIPLRYEEAN